ncbi:hypothetical protein SDJN03_20395, partial [Cucurbita argyrosperma subsp. sororia]
MLLLCVWFLVLQPEGTSGLSNIDLALRWDKLRIPIFNSFKFVKEASVEDDWGRTLAFAPAPLTGFDPTRLNKRRIRRGSDPIHNKC